MRGSPRLGRRELGASVAALWFVVVLLIGSQGSLDAPASRMLAIFGAAVVLWITEAIPLAATSIFVILAQILLISDEAILAVPAAFEPPSYESIFATLADPVLMLFLGGFVLADAATKYGLDRNLAGVLLRPFGTAPTSIIAGLMCITALLSMFVSNTATTAAMMAVVLPVVAGLDAGDRLRIAVVLSVPVAANIGGIGTPVGSPPNAIVIGRLSQQGERVDFLQWMVLAIPVALVVLVAAWFVLTRVYRSDTTHLEIRLGGEFDRSRRAVVLYLVFGLTVVGWMTEPLHGVPSAIVGFVPVVVLMATRVIGTDDLKRINWHILWLVGGGIALGNGVAATGLDGWFIDRFDWGSMTAVAFAGALAAISLGLSTVISNSATANLVAPIGIGIAASGVVDLAPLLTGLIIAMACSLAMALPISTPPNAVAYASGLIEPRDLARVGLIVGAVGIIIVAVVAPPVWQALGLV
jgi:solute carrier family 13 (sodium-dependent dicarboxylate transporter), member 2/3/5